MPKKIKAFRFDQPYEQRTDRKADKRWYTQIRWKKLRKAFLTANPLCQCDDDCGQLAEQVHHRIDRKDRPDLAFAWSNLQSLTRACHSKITLRRQR